MIKDGHEFLEWLHRIREADSDRWEKMSPKEYAEFINREAERLLEEAGYARKPAPNGTGYIIVKREDA